VSKGTSVTAIWADILPTLSAVKLQQKSLLKFVAEDKLDTHSLQGGQARDWAGQSIHVLIMQQTKPSMQTIMSS
jgi:hypothetical protein